MVVEMSSAILFDDKSVKGFIKENLKKICQSRITPTKLFVELQSQLGDKYAIAQEGSDIYIRPDKRKNITNVENEVRAIVNNLAKEKDFDLNFLFKVTRGTNGIIIRTKRL